MTLYVALILSMVLLGLQLLALEHDFYWVYWWFDVFMHFFTGFILGLFVYWVLFDSRIFGNGDTLRKSTRTLMVFTCVMVIGLLWEAMEYAYGLTNSHEGYPVDPLLDLALDGAGAVLATLLGFRSKNSPGRLTLNG